MLNNNRLILSSMCISREIPESSETSSMASSWYVGSKNLQNRVEQVPGSYHLVWVSSIFHTGLADILDHWLAILGTALCYIVMRTICGAYFFRLLIVIMYWSVLCQKSELSEFLSSLSIFHPCCSS
ncbi:hypothetical protein RB195_013115 [Necator americanus]|uniref:Uncharacterized protein n=1 Tax=Necator americanus TaxID=51031 RepID=A0ABR1DU19_NECAM